MRNHRLALAALACALWSPRVAHADDTVFDFVAPRADQTGDYQADARALVSGGVGTLRPIAGWFDEGWRYRLPLSLVNPGTAALAEWPMAVIADAAASAAEYDVFHLAQPTGADLRVVGGGGLIEPLSLGVWDDAANRGRIWFQVAALAPGTSNYFLYFGNHGTLPLDDPLAVFSYSTPYPSRYALEPAGSIMRLGSLADDNDYETGALNGTLTAGELLDIASGDWQMGQTVAASRPIEVHFTANTGAEGAPIAFARTLQGIAVPRGAINEFRMVAPFADTSVAVAIDGAATATVDLTAGVASTWASDVPDGSAVTFTSASPILIAHRSDDSNDGYVLPPPAAEVWGFRSGTPRVLAFGSDTDITAYDSNGVVETQTIAAGTFATITGNGVSGTAEALHIVATESGTSTPAPITVLCAGDGDGGDAMVMHPTSELGRSWIVPSDSTFAMVALTRAGASCTLTPPGGGAPTTVTADPAVTAPFPGRIMFGAETGVNVTAGSMITCDAHGFAYHEDEASQDERNLYPMEAHRKNAAAPPYSTLGDALETRYNAAVAGTIDTPDAVAPTAIVDWTDFRVATEEPAGTEIQYQVSIDSGATWLVPSDTSWIVAPDHLFGATAGAIRDALASLDTNTGRIRIHTILKTEDGVTRPEVDAIRVFYDAAGAADRLRWNPLPTTIIAGVSVDAVLTAIDVNGTTITGINGDIALTSSHDGQVLPATVTMTGGRAEFDLKLTGTADDVTLRAEGPDGLVGISSMFDLVAPEGARLEYVSGNDQFGVIGTLLGEPFTARVVDAADSPIAGVQVTFAVTEGGGTLDPGGASTAVITDGAGEATAFLRLGNSPGAQRVRCEGAGGTVEFVARADLPGEGDGDSGGCCDTGRSSHPLPSTLLLIALVGAALSRRRS